MDASQPSAVTLTLSAKANGVFPVMNSVPMLSIGPYNNALGRLSPDLRSITFTIDQDQFDTFPERSKIVLRLGAYRLEYGTFDSSKLDALR